MLLHFLFKIAYYDLIDISRYCCKRGWCNKFDWFGLQCSSPRLTGGSYAFCRFFLQLLVYLNQLSFFLLEVILMTTRSIIVNSVLNVEATLRSIKRFPWISLQSTTEFKFSSRETFLLRILSKRNRLMKSLRIFYTHCLDVRHSLMVFLLMSAVFVYKDAMGKTQPHRNGCPYNDQRGEFSCHCCRRLSYNTVDSYIGKLRSIFSDTGSQLKEIGTGRSIWITQLLTSSLSFTSTRLPLNNFNLMLLQNRQPQFFQISYCYFLATWRSVCYCLISLLTKCLLPPATKLSSNVYFTLGIV